jgi:hypothetical protein
MKTLFVRGDHPPPAELLEIVRQGSTSLDQVSTKDLATYVSKEGLGVDRLVFWAADADPEVRSLAGNYGSAADVQGRRSIFYVTVRQPDPPPEGLGYESVFVWPADTDKLKMAFMTGA